MKIAPKMKNDDSSTCNCTYSCIGYTVQDTSREKCEYLPVHVAPIGLLYVGT